MEELLLQFDSTVINKDAKCEIIKCYDEMYKNWGKLRNQDQRRRDILKVQKSKRNEKVDKFRGILELVTSVKETDCCAGSKKHGSYRPSIYVSGFTKVPTTYYNVLMMSEWMIEKPFDFEDSWYVVPCPKGVRTLIVACQGNTTCYNKYGTFKMSCRTALPGGNPCDPNYTNNCVVLDGFLVESLNTLYILDLLAWNNQPMTDGETDFRYYWLKTHIEDIPELRTINAKNKILFEVLPKHECDPKSFNEFMMTCPYFKDNMPVVDGLLFYHKMAHYDSGATPLVGWLYPFMVNEVLGADVTVHPIYTMNKPADYLNQAKYIKRFEKTNLRRMPKLVKYSKMEAASEDKHDADMVDRSNITFTETSENSIYWRPTTSFLSRPKLLVNQDTATPSTNTSEPMS